MKNKMIRALSFFLTALMLAGVLAALPVGAATTSKDDDEIDLSEIEYTTQVYNSPEEKLATMKLYYSKYNYDLYMQEYTGEVALVNKVTGEMLFSNPYDVAKSTGAESTKKQILSQIAIRYTGTDGTTRNFYSYEEAAQREQISIERIKSGVRVEYTLGDENARKLVPKMISDHSMNDNILTPCKDNGITDFLYAKLTGFYVRYDISEMTSQTAIDQAVKKYPLLETMSIWILDTKATSVEMNTLEKIIKQYAPEYTYEQMDEDYAEVEYVDESSVTAVFSLALEYSINEDGMTVRLPANGIRFNSAQYTLQSISVLPYMGAGNNANTGYTFYPDGSGALFRFEDLKDVVQTTNVRNMVYGTDYAYHTITGKYQQAVRYPVFGIHEDKGFYTCTAEVTPKDSKGNVTGDSEIKTLRFSKSCVDSVKAVNTAISSMGNAELLSEITETMVTAGFFAVIEEGESMTEIATYHGGSTSDYNTIITYFNPRPTDSYEVNDVISVSDVLQASTSTWNVSSDRKYSGNLKIRYFMLTDETLAEENNLTDWYATDYNGMAKVYQNYLIENGTFDRLTSADVQEDIPLFIETFGCLEGEVRIATIPLEILQPLASFDDIKAIYEDLNESGIKNVFFQMVGYVNGGMYYSVPGQLKWERAVGGKSGFKDLVEYAEEVNAKDGYNLALFPDFDFVWLKETAANDGLNMKRDCIKTIDNRYTRYRKYSPTYQTYVKDIGIAISPASYSRFYTKLLKKYDNYGLNNISVSTLGQYVNSDFDKKEPYNREDDKEFVANALASISESVSNVMVTGGNSITWKYADYLLEAPVSSSRYVRASNEVPFFGMVAHGFLQYAGTAANMDGDTTTAVLKAIENGGSIFYVLSYENTELLKEDEFLNEYYSIDYDIWSEDVKSTYLELNSQMKDVQTKLILSHEFLTGRRVPDTDELMADLAAALADNYASEKETYDSTEARINAEINAAREYLITGVTEAQTAATAQKKASDDLSKSYSKVDPSVTKAETAKKAYEASPIKKNLTTYETAKKDLGSKYRTSMQSIVSGQQQTAKYFDVLNKAAEALNFIKSIDGMLDSIIAEAEENLAAIEALEAGITETEKTFADRAASLLEKVSPYLTAAEIKTYTPVASSSGSSTTSEETVAEEEVVFDKLLSDDGNIVAVTYGGKNGDDAAAYKTFIINYNSFAVVVDYNGVRYTIPATDYVAIYR